MRSKTQQILHGSQTEIKSGKYCLSGCENFVHKQHKFVFDAFINFYQ